MPMFPDLLAPLSDGVVCLRLAAERDIPEILIAHQDDPHLYVRLGLERPPSGAELGRAAEQAATARLSGAQVALTIVLPGSDDCIGQLYTPEVEWPQDRADVAMWLAPQVRGRGLAPRALRLASRWLIEACDLQRLQILTDPGNTPMLRTAQRAGYRPEGVLHAYTRERHGRGDCAILSLLPCDLLSP
jgi:RimJ/RimL family protein N-acetyltransferase